MSARAGGTPAAFSSAAILARRLEGTNLFPLPPRAREGGKAEGPSEEGKGDGLGGARSSSSFSRLCRTGQRLKCEWQSPCELYVLTANF